MNYLEDIKKKSTNLILKKINFNNKKKNMKKISLIKKGKLKNAKSLSKQLILEIDKKSKPYLQIIKKESL